MIPRVDTAPHGVENPTPGALWAGLSGLQPLEAARFSMFINHDIMDLLLAIITMK